MKHLLLLGLVLGLIALNAAAADNGPTNADQAWAEWEAWRAVSMPGDFTAWTMRQQREWNEQRALQRRERGLAFLESFPADPRRWIVAWQMINGAPGFVRSYGPNADKNYNDVIIDRAAAAAWTAKLAELEKALRTAPDLPPEVREALDLQDVQGRIRQIYRDSSKDQSAKRTMFIREIMAFASKYPESAAPANMAQGVMYDFETAHPVAEVAVQWRAFEGSRNPQLDDLARNKVQAFESISGGIELTFTALDGREVNLKKQRGKVVLLDFWATWCVPCLAEMPNVKKVYSAYHDKGFEIVGVSCDYAPGQAGSHQASAAKTGPQVLEFCQTNGMPWPEYYDGRKHNEGGNLLAKRFAITGIPGSLLIDQAGNVVALNLRGEKLEQEVKRLLSLPATPGS